MSRYFKRMAQLAHANGTQPHTSGGLEKPPSIEFTPASPESAAPVPPAAFTRTTSTALPSLPSQIEVAVETGLATGVEKTQTSKHPEQKSSVSLSTPERVETANSKHSTKSVTDEAEPRFTLDTPADAPRIEPSNSKARNAFSLPSASPSELVSEPVNLTQLATELDLKPRPHSDLEKPSLLDPDTSKATHKSHPILLPQQLSQAEESTEVTQTPKAPLPASLPIPEPIRQSIPLENPKSVQPLLHAELPTALRPQTPNVEVKIGSITLSLEPEPVKPSPAPPMRPATKPQVHGIWSAGRGLARAYVRGV